MLWRQVGNINLCAAVSARYRPSMSLNQVETSINSLVLVSHALLFIEVFMVSRTMWAVVGKKRKHKRQRMSAFGKPR
jgi:hypothetical protein